MATKKTPVGGDLAEHLRGVIRASGLTHYRIGKEAGCNPVVLDRFLRGSDLRLSTLSKLAPVLGLALVSVK